MCLFYVSAYVCVFVCVCLYFCKCFSLCLSLCLCMCVRGSACARGSISVVFVCAFMIPFFAKPAYPATKRPATVGLACSGSGCMQGRSTWRGTCPPTGIRGPGPGSLAIRWPLFKGNICLINKEREIYNGNVPLRINVSPY